MNEIECRETQHGTISIYQLRCDGSVLYMQGKGIQSHADERGEALLGYAQMICCAVLSSGARSALVIGCAGGTIATTLRRRGLAVAALDINPDAFELAAKYFHMPADIETHLIDGREYLEATDRRWGAIVVDAYDGMRPPAHLISAEFYALVAERLLPAGIVVSNVVTAHKGDMTADRVASAIRETGLPIRLFDNSEDSRGNCIVTGGLTPSNLKVMTRQDSMARSLFQTFRQRRPRYCSPIHE